MILFQLRSRSSAWLERRADKGLLSLEKKVSLEIKETTIVVFQTPIRNAEVPGSNPGAIILFICKFVSSL